MLERSKIVTIKHFGWRNGADHGRIAVILPCEASGDNIGFRQLVGKAPSIGMLRQLLAVVDPDGSLFAKGIELCKTRTQPFGVEKRTGMSSARDYKLRVLKDSVWNDAPIVAKLHVSCANKFNEGVGPMWLGDFVVLASALLADYNYWEMDQEYEFWECKLPEISWLLSSQVDGYFERMKALEELQKNLRLEFLASQDGSQNDYESYRLLLLELVPRPIPHSWEREDGFGLRIFDPVDEIENVDLSQRTYDPESDDEG